jgi:hypothetical protein
MFKVKPGASCNQVVKKTPLQSWDGQQEKWLRLFDYAGKALQTHHAAADAQSELAVLDPIWQGVRAPDKCEKKEIREAAQAQLNLSSWCMILEREHGFAAEFIRRHMGAAIFLQLGHRVAALNKEGVVVSAASSSSSSSV